MHDDLKGWITIQAVLDDPQAYLFRSLAHRSVAGRNGLCKAFQEIMDLPRR
jgi:hypothetical protein